MTIKLFERCIMRSMLAVIIVSCATAAHLTAATFTVTTTADNGDNVAPTPGSLREAIIDSNEVLPLGTFNVINFKVAGTIVPPTDLPIISNNPVFINGYSAPGASPNTNSIREANNAVITVTLLGPGPGYALPGPINGLVLGGGSDGSIIQGLAIGDFALVPSGSTQGGAGIFIESGHNLIFGCFIGTDASGEDSHPCFDAIFNLGNNNLIGGEEDSQRNLLSGQYGGLGILFDGGNSTLIIGNTIGLDRSGTEVLMSAQRIGLAVEFNAGAFISNNVIAGCDAANVVLRGTDQVKLFGNLIGTDVSGTQTVDFNGIGVIVLDSPLNGPTDVNINSNVISGNTYGVHVGENDFSHFPYNGVRVLNNFVGVDITGKKPLPNEFDGVWVKFGLNTYIAGNTISSNGRFGLRLGKSKGAQVISNFIGTDLSKTLDLGNGSDGIRLGGAGIGFQASCDVIGGAKPGEGNFIAHNAGNGIGTISFVEGEEIIGNTITQNGKNGIYLGKYANRNWIGIFRTAGSHQMVGDLAGQENTNLGVLGTSNLITLNGNDGIKLQEANGNVIQTNLINANKGSGIELVNAIGNVIGSKFKGSSTIPPTLANIITDNSGYGILELTPKRNQNRLYYNVIKNNALGKIRIKKTKFKSCEKGE